MSSSSSRRLSALNIPRLVLWVASIVVAGLGYLLMTTSNASEASVYTSTTADYPKLFAAQSGSTIGGMLIVAGVIGVLLALTSMAITRRSVEAPVIAVIEEDDVDLLDLDHDDETVDETVDEPVDEPKVVTAK